MGLNTLIENDLQLIYDELYDVKALYKNVSLSVFFSDDYEVQSSKEKVITAQSKDVAEISNSDIFTIGGIDYKVITFNHSPDGLETTIGLEK